MLANDRELVQILAERGYQTEGDKSLGNSSVSKVVQALGPELNIQNSIPTLKAKCHHTCVP